MCRLLKWKVGWFFTLDDASAVLTGRMIHLHCVDAMRDQRSVMGNGRKAVNGCASNARCALHDGCAIVSLSPADVRFIPKTDISSSYFPWRHGEAARDATQS
jgi:hypothetical protein